MPLNPTQRDFVLNQLKVKPKGRGIALLSKDVALRDKLDDYLRREGKAITAIATLKTLAGTGALVARLEGEVQSLQRQVVAAGRDDGTGVFKTAYDKLETIKEEARAGVRDAEAYRDALAAANLAVGRLAAPVLGDDVKKLRADLIAAAEDRATASQLAPAMALLQRVAPECTRIEGLGTAYAQALAQARRDLQDARASMLSIDIPLIETTMIAAAEHEASRGKRVAALGLLAKVAPACTLGKKQDVGRYEAFIEPLVKLKAHAQKAAFATEIAAIDKKLASAKANSEAGFKTKNPTGSGSDQSFVGMEMNQLYWEATKQLEFADEHAAYVVKRDQARAAVDSMKNAVPTASNTKIAAELQLLEDGIAKAGRQADKRLYEAAAATLAKVTADTASVGVLKQAHATWTAELARIEELLKKVPGAPDPVAAAEAAALATRLAQAKALAEPGRDYAGAIALLARIGTDCQACIAHADTLKLDAKQRDEALAGLDRDTAASLAAVRKLFEQLKTRAGHTGIPKQLADIERILKEADTALRA